MVLSVSSLTVSRAGRPVLSDLSFDLMAGQALRLQGRNGIGKTTLLRCLAGLQPPLAGRIVMAADSLAYAGHADGVKLQLTVLENLRFWADIFGCWDIERALQAFELGPLSDRLAGTLSAGQRRRLGLARLLLTNRPLWLLDEPTVSLDDASVTLFAAAVYDHLQAEGAVLIASHIDLGLPAEVLALEPYRAELTTSTPFDESFS
jgi:heme exporter protein A